MEKEVPEIKEWHEHFHQSRNDYNGKDFNGPQLTRLMKDDSIANLRQVLSHNEANSDCMLYFEAMLAFVSLKKVTFKKYVSLTT